MFQELAFIDIASGTRFLGFHSSLIRKRDLLTF